MVLCHVSVLGPHRVITLLILSTSVTVECVRSVLVELCHSLGIQRAQHTRAFGMSVTDLTPSIFRYGCYYFRGEHDNDVAVTIVQETHEVISGTDSRPTFSKRQ